MERGKRNLFVCFYLDNVYILHIGHGNVLQHVFILYRVPQKYGVKSIQDNLLRISNKL